MQRTISGKPVMDVALPPQRPAALPVSRPLPDRPIPATQASAPMPVAPAPPHAGASAAPAAAAMAPRATAKQAPGAAPQLPLALITVTLFAMLVLSTLAIIIYLTSSQA